MFQLIVAVVGIMLIAIIALSAIYFGGSAHTEASVRAEYAGNMNAAAQIESAMQLYFQEHGHAPPGEDEVLLNHLVEKKYLKSIPDGDWTVRSDAMFKALPLNDRSLEHCVSINRVAGLDVSADDLISEPYKGCPPCSGVAGSPAEGLAFKYRTWPACQFLSGS